MSEKRPHISDSEVRNKQHSSDMVARVARAVGDAPFDAWSIAETALEASHHAELAAALTMLLAATNPQQHKFAPVFLGEAQEQARSVLAKIGGEA